MQNINFRRRKVLSGILAGAAGGAMFGLLPWSGRKKDDSVPLLLGVGSIPDHLFRSIEKNYLAPVAKVLGGNWDIFRARQTSSFEDGERLGFHAYLTSPALHPILPPQHVTFGAMPFGLLRDEKLDYLLSPQGQQDLANYFDQFDLRAHLVAVGSDRFGMLSNRDVVAAKDLEGARAAMSDYRAKWYKRIGMVPVNVAPHKQIPELAKGSLDMTEPLPPTVWLEQWNREAYAGGEASLTYLKFPRIRTAPTLFVLWRKPTFKKLSSSQIAKIESLCKEAAVETSRIWEKQESSAETKLAAKFPVSEIPKAVVDLFVPDAMAYGETIAKLSFARKAAPSLG